MTKRALLVGINKYEDAPLDGCINDVDDMVKFLKDVHGFRSENITVLKDKQATTRAMKANLIALVSATKPKDEVVFHFSGHGVQMPSKNDKGEVDSLDEAICPYDFDWSETRVIRDNTLETILSKLTDGVDFLWVSDSCHSGGLSRMPGGKSGGHMMRKPRSMPVPDSIAYMIREAKSRGVTTAKSAFKDDARGAELNRLMFISGCKSSQTSADAWFHNRANGALTYNLLKELRAHPTSTFSEVLTKVREELASGDFDQVPQLLGNQKLLVRPLFG